MPHTAALVINRMNDMHAPRKKMRGESPPRAIFER
jgi:hypothetical protein